MGKPALCKDCGTDLMGHLLSGARQRRCTGCHRAFKASFGKETCSNCGVEVLYRGTCETCEKHYPQARVLDYSNINQMLWYDGKKAWE